MGSRKGRSQDRAVARTSKRRRVPDKSLVSWPSGKQQRVQQHIDRLMSQIVIDENGRTSTGKIFEREWGISALSHLVEIQNADDWEVKKSLVGATTWRLKRAKRQDTNTFRRMLAAATRRYLSRVPEHLIVVLTSNLSLGIRPGGQIAARGIVFRQQGWSGLSASLDIEAWRSQEPGFRSTRPHSTVLYSAEVEARSNREAIEIANQDFDLVRLAFNCIYADNLMYSMSGRRRPLAEIPSPHYWGVFSVSGNFRESYHNPHPQTLPIKRPIRNEIVAAKRMLRRFDVEHRDNSILRLYEDAVRRYNDALDTTDWRQAFLDLWRVLELISFPTSDRYSMDEVADRIAGLLGNHWALRDLLSSLAHSRNKLVHTGAFPTSALDEVNLAKAMVEHSLGAIWSLRRRCPTKADLVEYHQVSRRQVSDIKRLERALRTARARPPLS